MGGARNTLGNTKEDEGGDGDNIEINLKPMGWKSVDWIYLTQNISQ
jgi:hypothetical protein